MKNELNFYHEINPNLSYDRETLRWNGWGAYEEDFHAAEHMPAILDFLRGELSVDSSVFTPPAPLEEISLPKANLSPLVLKNLQTLVGSTNVTIDKRERILHSAGRSYYDVVRLHWNALKNYVDAVVYPRDEKDVTKVLQYCNKNKITVIPYGGGSSVVGALEAIKGKSSKSIISLDLTRLKSLIDINEENQTAQFQAGIYGPHLEKALNERGYTLGHFPQSFVYSTLGGWIAARSAGQQSNRYGKIEEMISSVKMITVDGEIETGTYPASSSGPDWNHIIAGSEGLLGIITSATVKIRPIPEKRLYFGFLFSEFKQGKEFIREVNQAEIETSMMRLSDEEETRLFGTLGTLGKKGILSKLKHSIQNKVLSFYKLNQSKTALIVGLDGDEETVYQNYIKIREIANRHKAFHVGESMGRNWIKNRFNMPFLRNHIMEYGFGVDTMETSAPYDKLEEIRNDFHSKIRKAFPHSVSLCHISHSYHNGACLYFTVIFKMDTKKPIEEWKKLKKIASDVFLSHGASASHHHGIGNDHKDWYQKEFGKVAISGLSALKESLDKNGILNPNKVFHN